MKDIITNTLDSFTDELYDNIENLKCDDDNINNLYSELAYNKAIDDVLVLLVKFKKEKINDVEFIKNLI